MKMTNSLLAAYDWYCSCPPSWKDRALDGLKNTLTQGFTGTAATARGDKFEEKVNRALRVGEEFTGVQQPLNVLRGMQTQVWLNPFTLIVSYKKKELSFTFRGKMDYIGYPAKELLSGWGKKKIIADLKTTGGNIKQGKYTDSMQHIIYCLAMDIPRFAYVVCQFPTEASMEPVAVEIFPIDLTDGMDCARGILEGKVSGLVKLLHDFNLWKDYFEIFNGGKE